MQINFWYCISVLKVPATNIQPLAFPEIMWNFTNAQFVALIYWKGEVKKLEDYTVLKILSRQVLRNQNISSVGTDVTLDTHSRGLLTIFFLGCWNLKPGVLSQVLLVRTKDKSIKPKLLHTRQSL